MLLASVLSLQKAYKLEHGSLSVSSQRVLSLDWFLPGRPTAHSRGHNVSPHLPVFLRACFLFFHPSNLYLPFESSTVTFPIRYSVVHRDLVSPVAHQVEMTNGLRWWKPMFRIVQTWVRLGLLTSPLQRAHLLWFQFCCCAQIPWPKATG